MKLFFYNFLFLILFSVIGASITEVYLRFDGRYEDLVSENLVRSRAIWDRPANQIQYRKHPDLEYEVEIIFNDFQIRNHHGFNLADAEKFSGKLVGVFGDSFTENRRINDEFTFTSILNKILGPDYQFLNFGVDAYGLDQSYLKYLDFKHHQKMSHVFYVFYTNDLRNIYENQIFDFSGTEPREPIHERVNPVIDIIRKFHLTYLILDSIVRVKAKLQNETHQTETLNEKLLARFTSNSAKVKQRKRYHDEYADSIAKDFLSSEPSTKTLEWGRRFNLLLELWKKNVETNNGTFTILVIPSQTATDLAKKLFGEKFSADTVYLIDNFPNGFNKFKNDGHWNESGNLRAAITIAEWGAKSKQWTISQSKVDHISTNLSQDIRSLYYQE